MRWWCSATSPGSPACRHHLAAGSFRCRRAEVACAERATRSAVGRVRPAATERAARLRHDAAVHRVLRRHARVRARAVQRRHAPLRDRLLPLLLRPAHAGPVARHPRPRRAAYAPPRHARGARGAQRGGHVHVLHRAGHHPHRPGAGPVIHRAPVHHGAGGVPAGRDGAPAALERGGHRLRGRAGDHPPRRAAAGSGLHADRGLGPGVGRVHDHHQAPVGQRVGAHHHRLHDHPDEPHLAVPGLPVLDLARRHASGSGWPPAACSAPWGSGS